MLLAEKKHRKKNVDNFTARKNEGKKTFINDISQGHKTSKMKAHSNEVEEEGTYSDDSQYSVEDIVDKKVFKGRAKYLVKWRGYEEPTWEKEENLNCTQLVKEFEDRRQIKKNDQKIKIKRKGILKSDLNQRGNITIPHKRDKLILENSNHKSSKKNNSITTARAKVSYENAVTTKRKEISLKNKSTEEINFLDSFQPINNFKRRSLSHKISSWVKKDVSQKANASAIETNKNHRISCGSPLGEKDMSVEKKRRSSSPSGTKSKTESEMAVVKYTKSPLRLPASTNTLFGSPLDIARPSKKTGIAERVIGARLVGEQIMFLVKWQGCDLPDWVPSRIANMQFPQLVIKYYEDRLMWNTSSQESTPR